MRRPRQARGGATQPTPLGVPVPGSASGKPRPKRAHPVRIAEGGFFADLPPPGVQFFDRVYERAFPKPLQTIAGGSFQKGYDLWSKREDEQRVLIIRDIAFTAFRNDTIGVGRPIPVAPGVLSDSIGWQFTIGERWQIDIKNNQQGVGSPLQQQLGGGKGLGSTETNIAGRFDPLGGSFARRYGANGKFTLYAQPNERLNAKFFVMVPPPVELLKMQFRINGFSIPQALWIAALQTGAWGLYDMPRRSEW